MSKLISKGKVISGVPLTVDNPRTGDMRPITSNAVKRSIEDAETSIKSSLDAKVETALSEYGITGKCESLSTAQNKIVILETESESIPKEFDVIFTHGNSFGDTTLETPTYPSLVIKNKVNMELGVIPLGDSHGHYAGAGCYNDGDTMAFRIMGNKACIMNSDVRQVTKDYIIYANGKTVYTTEQIDNSVVKYVSQSLENTQKEQARTNIGACANNDSRLSDARPASDVSDWAKASTKPTYTASEVGACADNDSRLSNSRTPTAHNQASSTINAMTGYSKPSSTSAIAATDSLNSAIGKLEKAIDGKTSNTGTVTSVAVKMNGTTKGTVTTSGTIDLGTVITDAGGTVTSGTLNVEKNTINGKVTQTEGRYKIGNISNLYALAINGGVVDAGWTVGNGTLIHPQKSGRILGDADSSIDQSGYLKLTNGLIIQWGQIVRGSNFGANSDWKIGDIEMPMSFSNTSYSVYLSLEAANSGLEFRFEHVTSKIFNTSAWNRNSGTTVKMPIVHWFAIGF